ncbi:hypothetical protein BKA70DRAFT_1307686 [Coprinopsis sp. MPI-PUGE-AT-0042]|nr:hypothetical protein BKA70DRAFT_1307686 [Coprinopsis sp. MPI-PUGE-AT-0042]
MSRDPDQGEDAGSSPIFEVIYNPDILDTIFLYFDNTNSNGRNQLYRFSLVCKSFKGPALRQLWEILDSYIPLLNLLPRLEEFNNEYHFYGKLAGSAFDEYANRVRGLQLVAAGDYGSKFSGQVFSRLAKELNGSPLLPGLRRATIYALDAVATTLIPLLFHPHLQSLEYNPQEGHATQLHHFVFPSLQDCCSDLRKLTITIDDSASAFPILILDSVFGLKRLKHLEIRALSMAFSPADLAKLGANCPDLTTLHLDISFDHPSPHGCPAAPVISAEGFPNLEHFHLTARNASTYHVDANYDIGLCSSWPKSLMAKITSLTVIASTSFYSYESLVGALRQGSRFRRLEISESVWMPSNIYPADIVQTLPIPTLAEVVWDVSTLTTPSSSQNLMALQEIVEAGFTSASCPKGLRSLVLPIAMRYPFSLKSLRYIADNAVGLESLSICIDSSPELEDPVGPIHGNANPVSHSTLRHLRICDQRTSDTFHPTEYRYLAEYLDAIFPNLESLGVHKDSRGDGGFYKDHWDSIECFEEEAQGNRQLT